MILLVAVDLMQVSALGRNFPWKKAMLCPCCGQSHLWGHGFSDTYFEGLSRRIAGTVKTHAKKKPATAP